MDDKEAWDKPARFRVPGDLARAIFEEAGVKRISGNARLVEILRHYYATREDSWAAPPLPLLRSEP